VAQNEILMKDYLNREFKFSTIPKYYKYFEEWFKNLTENQMVYLEAYSKGKKTPFTK
jgi:hypothetical protein